MSRARIGLGVGSAFVRAVLVRNGVVVRRVERGREDGLTLRATVADVLRECGGGRRPEVFAAFGPSLAQFKNLHGLSGTLPPALAAEAVAANLDRFFVGDPDRLQLTAVARVSGQLWGGVVPIDTVEEVAGGCRDAKVSLRGCAPTLAVMGTRIGHGVVDWRDGDVLMTAAYADGDPVRVQLTHEREGDPSFEVDGVEYDDAIAIATVASSSPHLFDPGAMRRRARARRTLRAALAAVLAGAVLGALLGPGLAARHRTGVAVREMATLEGALRVAEGRVRRHLDAQAANARVSAFRNETRAVVPLLAALVRELPESTAIVSLRVDGQGLGVVALAPAGAEVLEGLARVPGVARPQLVGAITRETFPRRTVQRIALSARFVGPGTGGIDAVPH